MEDFWEYQNKVIVDTLLNEEQKLFKVVDS